MLLVTSYCYLCLTKSLFNQFSDSANAKQNLLASWATSAVVTNNEPKALGRIHLISFVCFYSLAYILRPDHSFS